MVARRCDVIHFYDVINAKINQSEASKGAKVGTIITDIDHRALSYFLFYLLVKKSGCLLTPRQDTNKCFLNVKLHNEICRPEPGLLMQCLSREHEGTERDTECVGCDMS